MDALQATAMDLDDAAEAPPDPLEVAFEAAANASDPGAAYLAVLTDAEHALTEAGARAKEQCVYKLAERDSKNKNFGDVAVLLERAAPFFGQVAKAKVAKIVRKLLDIVAAHADTLDLQAELCLKVVAWCRAEKRTFLRQRVEARLVQIDFERARYDEWCFYAVAELDAHTLYVIRKHRDLVHLYGEAPNAIKTAQKGFANQVQHAERALADGRQWLLGSTFTAADILLALCLDWARAYKQPLAPVLSAYADRATAREAYRAAVEREWQ